MSWERPLHGVFHPGDVHALLKAGAGFGAHPQGAGRTAHAVPAEFGAFEEQVGGIGLDFAVQPAHDARQAGGRFGVGDDQHVSRQGMGFAVQGGDGLAVLGAAHDDFAPPHIPEIEGVHGCPVSSMT